VDSAPPKIRDQIVPTEGDHMSVIEVGTGDSSAPIPYLAIPPVLFATVITGLGAAGLAEQARDIGIRKPPALARTRPSASQLVVEATRLKRVSVSTGGRLKDPRLFYLCSF